MHDSHYYLLGYVALHYAGLLGTVIAGYVIAGLVANTPIRMAGRDFGAGQMGAFLAISTTFVATLGIGLALFFLEVLFAANNYGELLDAFLHNHWLASIPPTFAAFYRHGYVEQWLNDISGARTTS